MEISDIKCYLGREIELVMKEGFGKKKYGVLVLEDNDFILQGVTDMKINPEEVEKCHFLKS